MNGFSVKCENNDYPWTGIYRVNVLNLMLGTGKSAFPPLEAVFPLIDGIGVYEENIQPRGLQPDQV